MPVKTTIIRGDESIFISIWTQDRADVRGYNGGIAKWGSPPIAQYSYYLDIPNAVHFPYSDDEIRQSAPLLAQSANSGKSQVEFMGLRFGCIHIAEYNIPKYQAGYTFPYSGG